MIRALTQGDIDAARALLADELSRHGSFDDIWTALVQKAGVTTDAIYTVVGFEPHGPALERGAPFSLTYSQALRLCAPEQREG